MEEKEADTEEATDTEEGAAVFIASFGGRGF
jgi:hypothetical protein